MNNILQTTIKSLITPGKGILAADESTNTIGKRLNQIKLDNTFENRTEWRKIICTTPNLEKYISGIILYDETLKTKINDNPIFNTIKNNGIVIGIKVDLGLTKLSGTNNETITQGLDDLENRCKNYFDLGARFTKWRGVFNISESTPTELCIEQNLDALARFAYISQKCNLVPIVEPEIIMEGNHEIGISEDVTREIISRLYSKLVKHKVKLEYTLLKPNMVRPGTRNPDLFEIPDRSIAMKTLNTLQNTVPILVPGVMFLSGGMNELQSTLVLNEINKLNEIKPWYLSFSYGRALQQSALQIWDGLPENILLSQQKLLEMCKNNSLATLGKF